MPCRRWNSYARGGGRELQHRRHGVGVVGRELRVDHLARGEQVQRALEVAGIGGGLRGVDREAGEPALLGALDLAVPVGALHQPHAHAPAAVARQLRHPVDHERRAAAVGLHRESEPVPAARRLIARQRRDDVQRDVEAVGLLGIDGAADAGARRAARQLQHARGQFLVDARTLQQRVARLEGGQLHRDARARVGAAGGCRPRVSMACA